MIEYFQFGFAGAFCLILYFDHRSTVRSLTKAVDRIDKSVHEVLMFVRDNADK